MQLSLWICVRIFSRNYEERLKIGRRIVRHFPQFRVLFYHGSIRQDDFVRVNAILLWRRSHVFHDRNGKPHDRRKCWIWRWAWLRRGDEKKDHKVVPPDQNNLCICDRNLIFFQEILKKFGLPKSSSYVNTYYFCAKLILHFDLWLANHSQHDDLNLCLLK